MILYRIKKFIHRFYLATTSFLLIFLLTLFVYHDSRNRAQRRSENLFQMRVSQAKAAIDRRVLNYVQILKGGKAFFASSDTVTREDYKRYISAISVEKNYPGLQGIGFARAIKPAELEEHIRQIRAEGFLGYAIKPAGERPFYTSIIYLEPFAERNLRAFGYDMFSEPTRRKAMELARDTNLPTVSGKVRLVQETNKDVQAGFLIYVPVYKNGMEPHSVEYRRRMLDGFVYSPFRVSDLMRNLLGQELKDLDIEIFDGRVATKDALLYDKDNSSSFFDPSSNGQLSRLTTLNISGHVWTLYFSAPADIGGSAERQLPNLVLAGGSIISLLMFMVISTLSRIKESNVLKQMITENATVALFTLNKDGYCTFINPAAEAMVGYTFAEMQHKTLHDMIHPKRPDGSPYSLAECVVCTGLDKGKNLRSHEDVFFHKDGTYINVSCSASSLYEYGVAVSTILEVRDITVEKKAQQAIVESEARFRSMADSAPVMIWINDASNNAVYLNKQWLTFTGQSLEEGLEQGWQAMVHPEDMDLSRAIYLEALVKQEAFKLEYRLRRKDGVYRWMVISATPRFNSSGAFLGYIGSVTDISERIEAEQKIKENADLLEKIFHKVPAIVGLIRASDQTYLLANPELNSLYSSNQSLVGRTMCEAHPDLEGQGLFEMVERVIQTGTPFYGQEVQVMIDRHADGNPIMAFFNLVFQPLFDDRQQVDAVLLFAVEVTELVQGRKEVATINKELNLKNEQLLRINNDLDNFVYTASHDLKSPIANLEGLSTMLHENLAGKLEDEDLRALHMVGISVNKLKKTITDLTNITRVQKEINNWQEPLCFDEILEDVKADVECLIVDSEATVITDFEVPKMMYARKNLRSILYNLLSNALKYRAPERPLLIRIRTEEEGEYTVLSVQDNGLGIKPQQQHKLFSMFTRLHTHVEGTGIGLYMIKRIIENDGGKICLDSVPGEGTTFKVYLKHTLSEATMIEENHFPVAPYSKR